MKIKNCTDYLLNDILIVNIKDFVYNLLKIWKLSFKGVLSLNIYYIKYIPTQSSDSVSIDRIDNNEDYLYLFIDVNRYIEENCGIKYLLFASTDTNK